MNIFNNPENFAQQFFISCIKKVWYYRSSKMEERNMYRIAKPINFMPLETRVIIQPQNKQGKIIAYGKDQDGEQYYLVDADITSYWKHPDQVFPL